MNCRHCQQRKANRPRGLCWRCYFTPGVKELYPVTSKYVGRGEPTEAELEAMLAEQAATMPPKGPNIRPPTTKLRSLQRQLRVG